MFFQPGEHQQHGLPHNPFKSLVVPRPIGWISSLSREGVVNLAPYSFFNAVADSPPCVFFASNAGPRPDGIKDSQRNAEETGEFVVNIATWDLRDHMNETSASVPPHVNEFELSGLTMAKSKLVAPPHVAESPISMECRYLQTVEMPSTQAERGNFVVFGEVLGFHIDDSIVNEGGLVEPPRFRPLARLGYMDYTSVEQVFSMLRPGQKAT